MIRALEHLLYKEMLRDLDVFNLEKAERGSPYCLLISKGWEASGWGQALFSGVQQQNKGQRAQTGTQKVPSDLYCEGDRAMEQSTQNACGVSSQNIQNPLGHFPVENLLCQGG